MNPKEKLVETISIAISEFQKTTGVYVEAIKMEYVEERKAGSLYETLYLAEIKIEYK
jgi:hypothetical protein